MAARFGAARVRTQLPVALGDHDEPEPDIFVTRRSTTRARATRIRARRSW
jgi:hypothetical protein